MSETVDHPNLVLLSRINHENIAASADVFAEDVVWRFFNPRLPEVQGDYLGLAGIQEFFEKLMTRTEGTFEIHPVLATPVGDELVVVTTKNRLTLDDAHIETDVVVVWRIVGGKVAEVWDIPSVYAADKRLDA